MSARNLFAYAIAGDSQVPRLNHSLEFLKAQVKSDIVVVASRCAAPIRHDQVLYLSTEDRFNDHQASIVLKTGLHRILGPRPSTCCYLDSDVIAVSQRADDIFKQKAGPVSFAADHGALARFSRYAVHCGCRGGGCDHLRRAIFDKFSVAISEPNWQHWNGGVYLFDAESTDFLDTWHRLTLSIFDDPFWRTRDQGTLIATVWQYGFQHLPLLDSRFNYIVDPLLNLSDDERIGLRPSGFSVDLSYSLHNGAGLRAPYLLHMINGGVGADGWSNWDHAASLLADLKSRNGLHRVPAFPSE